MLSKKAAQPGVTLTRRSYARFLPTPQVFLLPAAVTLLLWITSVTPVSLIQGLAAFILSCLPCWAYWRWQRTGYRGLPLFAAVSAMYWLYFSVVVFWFDRIA